MAARMVPARNTVPEGLLTRLYDKLVKNELVAVRHPSGDPNLNEDGS